MDRGFSKDLDLAEKQVHLSFETLLTPDDEEADVSQDPGDPETHWHRDDEAIGLPNLHPGRGRWSLACQHISCSYFFEATSIRQAFEQSMPGFLSWPWEKTLAHSDAWADCLHEPARLQYSS